MNKGIKFVLFQILIIFIGLVSIYFALNIFYEKEFNKFDYIKAEKIATDFLNKHENELTEIANKIYINKNSIKESYNEIKYIGYRLDRDFDYKNDEEYIQFDMEGQGMLGGQYYGLIFIKSDYDKVIIYDEKKETGSGNNVFVRKKIKNNWYFYYNDFDGKVDTSKIRKVNNEL